MQPKKISMFQFPIPMAIPFLMEVQIEIYLQKKKKGIQKTNLF
jgi:hypothetical protein